MEAKYYTPDLEEFYVGFEYEKQLPRLTGYHNEFDGYDWTKVTFRKFEELPMFSPETMQEYIRVKYLDTQDIEECGFKNMTALNFTDFLVFNKEDWWIDFYPTGILEIAGGCDTEIEGVHFIGKLKNKSELKVLLKQLNIK